MNKSLMLCVYVCILTVLRMESYTVIKRGAGPVEGMIRLPDQGNLFDVQDELSSFEHVPWYKGRRGVRPSFNQLELTQPNLGRIDVQAAMSNDEANSRFTVIVISTNEPASVTYFVDKNAAMQKEFDSKMNELEQAKTKLTTESHAKRIAEVSAEYAKERKGGAAASAAVSAAGGAEEKKAGQAVAAEREPISGAPGGPAFEFGAPKS